MRYGRAEKFLAGTNPHYYPLDETIRGQETPCEDVGLRSMCGRSFCHDSALFAGLPAAAAWTISMFIGVTGCVYGV